MTEDSGENQQSGIVTEKIYKNLNNLRGFPSTEKKNPHASQGPSVQQIKQMENQRPFNREEASYPLVILTMAFKYCLFTLQSLFLTHKTAGGQKTAPPASLERTTETRSEEERFREQTERISARM